MSDHKGWDPTVYVPCAIIFVTALPPNVRSPEMIEYLEKIPAEWKTCPETMKAWEEFWKYNRRRLAGYPPSIE